MTPQLPVEEIFDQLKHCLSERDEAVLEAPPGAGKTTLVPLTLLDQPWLAGRKILMLEPRRIATKSAAHRMANLLDEVPGQTVGYRMRLDTKVGNRTRIEIITEGILTRMLQQDPTLEDIGLVIFDEFHERNLDSDLALSLCLQGRELFGDANGGQAGRLKILVMSATLDSSALAQMLDDAPIITSVGRTYPVEIIYGRASQPKERIVERTVETIKRALVDNPDSSLLAFLPGQGEIHRVNEALGEWLLQQKINTVHLYPLFGNLSIEAQQQAVAPLTGMATGDQKVVLATNIAETSLTIDGVDVVVDSGLVREPRFDPATAMTSLQTRKISNASSIQRMGRAGRLKPGKCYRLWSQAQQQRLAAHASAEILQADLAPLALQLLQWGVDDPRQLRWLDPPPPGPWQQALDLLQTLGACEIKANGMVLTKHGKAMTRLSVHPRLAQMLLCGAAIGHANTAALLASLLSERDPFSHDSADIRLRLDLLTGETTCPAPHRGWLHRSQQLTQQFEQQLEKLNLVADKPTQRVDWEQAIGYLLACAYPDRIARRRHSGGYQLANGRSASIATDSVVANSRWLAVAEVSGGVGASGDSIRSAAKLDATLFDSLLKYCIHSCTLAEWDKKTKRFIAEEQQRIGALIWQRKTLNRVPVAAKQNALVGYIRKQGLNILPWTAELRQWCARVNLLYAVEGEPWPNLAQQNLLDSMDAWLAPYLEPVNLLQDFNKLNLKEILETLLSWEQRQRLNQLAPARFQVPSGSSITIDYRESPPVLAVKLQEMFGCVQTPSVVAGKVLLVVHLLSPAGRPVQITQDLAGFWDSSYHQIKKEMKGRYPKHPWPDDPVAAAATRKTKKHS